MEKPKLWPIIIISCSAKNILLPLTLNPAVWKKSLVQPEVKDVLRKDTGLRLAWGTSSLEVPGPFDEGAFIHTAACLFFLVTDLLTLQRSNCEVSIPVTHPMYHLDLGEGYSQTQVKSTSILFYFPPLSEEEYTFPLFIRFFLSRPLLP